MRKLWAFGVALLLAAPAMAVPPPQDVTYTDAVLGGPLGDIGLVEPGDPTHLNTVYWDNARLSDTYQFVFGIHVSPLDRGGDPNMFPADYMHFAFMYDNNSLEVLGAQPLGGWTTNDYADYNWPNPSSGILTISSLTNGFSPFSGFEELPVSAIVPFFQVTLHVKSDRASQVNAFGIVAMYMESHGGPLVIATPDFTYHGGLVHEVPEPASLTLVLGAVAALAGRLTRRRFS